MSKKQTFINEVQNLLDTTNYQWKSEDAKAYWEALAIVAEDKEKPLFTDNGKLILKYMVENQDTEKWKAKDIGEGLFISSRTVSGAIRKLVTDGYVDKIGQDPVLYTLTEKGKTTTIED